MNNVNTSFLLVSWLDAQLIYDGCTNRLRNKRNHTITGYHYILSNNELRNKWIIAIKGETLSQKENFALWGFIFKKIVFFVISNQNSTVMKRKFKLKDGAVPTKNGFTPSSTISGADVPHAMSIYAFTQLAVLNHNCGISRKHLPIE